MSIDSLSCSTAHQPGESATHLPAPRSPRHAALLLLAGISPPRRRASPGTPIEALASASNGCI